MPGMMETEMKTSKLKPKNRVKMTGDWMRGAGIFSDTRVGTVLKVMQWGESTMVEVLWDGETDLSIVAAPNLRRVGR